MSLSHGGLMDIDATDLFNEVQAIGRKIFHKITPPDVLNYICPIELIHIYTHLRNYRCC